MMAVNDELILFEGNINPGDQSGLRTHLQGTNDIEKETDKIDISVSNAKYIVDQFLSLDEKYGWGHLAFMVRTYTGGKNIIM